MSNDSRMAEIVQWREARPNGGWSDTLYKGLKIQDGVSNDHYLLVAKLSHGWRVMEVKDPSKIQFAVVPVLNVEIAEALMWRIQLFLVQDQGFQRGVGAALDKLLTGE